MQGMMMNAKPDPAKADDSNTIASTRSGLSGIQDVASRLDITQRALRFYEDKGLIEHERVGGTRLYSKREVGRIQLILRGKRLGFSLRDIKEFLDLYDSDPEHLEQMTRLGLQVRERLRDLEQQKVALDQTIGELRQIEKDAAAHVARLRGMAGN
jgi:DNA-binding transcriptional MerR regulator